MSDRSRTSNAPTTSATARGVLVGALAVAVVLVGAVWLLSDDDAGAGDAATLQRETTEETERYAADVALRESDASPVALEPAAPEPADADATPWVEATIEPAAFDPEGVLVEVRDPAGLPVAGAKVELWPAPHIVLDVASDDSSTLLTLTREDGTVLDVAPIVLTEPLEADFGTLELLLSDALERSGHSDPTGAVPIETVYSDSQGRARLHPGEPIRHVVAASQAPLGTALRWLRAQVPDGNDRTSLTSLVLQPRATLTGRVVEATDDPVIGCEVQLVPGPGMHPQRTPDPVFTDAEGRFSFQLDGPYVGTAYADPDGPEPVRLPFMVPSGNTTEIELRRLGAFEITGMVWGLDGRGVPDAPVRARHLENSDTIQAETDETGAFRLRPAYAGEWTLLADVSGFVQQRPAVRRVGRSQPSVHADLQLTEGAAIGGLVMLSDGTPLADIAVTALPQGVADDPLLAELHRATKTNTRTNEQGVYHLGGLHPRALYKVIAHGGSTLPGRVSREGVSPGQLDVGLVFGVDQLGGGVISGLVLEAATRAPVPSFVVASGTWHGAYGMTSAGSEGFDSGDGRFTLQGLEVGREYGLRVSAAGFDAATIGPLVATAQGIDVEILLGRPATLDVLVRDARGAPVPGATVQVLPLQPQLDLGGSIAARSGGTDPRGQWSTGIAPGAHWVEAKHPAHGRAGPVRIEVPDGGRRGVTLDLVAGSAQGAAEVTLRDADDQPLVGITVALASRDAVDAAQASGSKAADVVKVTTDGQGTARFGDRAAGVHVAMVIDGGLSFPPGIVVISEGEVARTTLRPLF